LRAERQNYEKLKEKLLAKEQIPPQNRFQASQAFKKSVLSDRNQEEEQGPVFMPLHDNEVRNSKE